MIRVNIQAIRDSAAERPAGYFEDVMSAGQADGDFVVLSDQAYDTLLEKYAGYRRPCGVGCHLKRLLERLGFRAVPGCKCDARATIMDAWGPDECQRPDRTREIVGWLKEEADRRGVLFVEAAARALLALAIRKARQG